MRFDNQLRYATRIIETYRGEIPLAAWLKDFFRANKQMGSRDRKDLRALVYGFYRLGHSLPELPVPDRLLAGYFLCNAEPAPVLQHFQPGWNANIRSPLREKIVFLQSEAAGASFHPTDIFPWRDEISPEIGHDAFYLSFLRQPDLFLRIRPGHKEGVLRKLGSAPFEFLPPSAIRLPNGFKVENYFRPDREVVVQDYSSQQIAGFLSLPNPPGLIWDTCAASGGKSIVAHDLYPDAQLIVSDIRESILHNLRKRFAVAGIARYTSFLADLTSQPPPAAAAAADLVLADLPCTGSGTWSRTPESLYFFDQAEIERHA
ncbi:MAG TPA: Fmu (Sun) domain-containing protein, partial [Puia sp.]|nr:Fmu (Sun) domain-containing protein [Puia sp.]